MLNKQEIKVLISLIDIFQFDGAEWTLEKIKLNKLKEKLLTHKKEKVCGK